MSEGNFRLMYRCPSCFLCWEESSDSEFAVKDKICDFCEKKPDSFALMQRRLEVLPKTQTRDFPAILQHMASHIKWKKIAFIKKKSASLLKALCCCFLVGCTYSVNMMPTEGSSKNRVEESQDIKTNLEMPFNEPFIP